MNSVQQAQLKLASTWQRPRTTCENTRKWMWRCGSDIFVMRVFTHRMLNSWCWPARAHTSPKCFVASLYRIQFNSIWSQKRKKPDKQSSIHRGFIGYFAEPLFVGMWFINWLILNSHSNVILCVLNVCFKIITLSSSSKHFTQSSKFIERIMTTSPFPLFRLDRWFSFAVFSLVCNFFIGPMHEIVCTQFIQRLIW